MNLVVLLPYLACGSSAALAVVAVWRARRTTADWAFVGGLVVLALERYCAARSLGGSTYGAVETWQQWRLVAASLLPGCWLLFSLTYARGNAAEFLVRRRLLWIGALVLPFATSIAYRAQLVGAVTEGERLGLRMGLPGVAFYVLVLTGAVLVLVNIERTFRAAIGTMRWRIKFMLLAVVLLFVVRIYTGSQMLLFRRIDPEIDYLNSGAAVFAVLLMTWSLVRAAHFKADVYPSQSILQSSFTALLAGAYLLGVGVLAKIAVRTGGDEAFAGKALLILLAIVLLAVLLQSDRGRVRFRHLISRHFQRPLHDYRAVWMKFTEGTAACVEERELCRSIAKLTAELFDALSVSLWLLDGQKDTLALAASTSASVTKQAERGIEPGEARDLITRFRSQPEAIDFESLTDRWAATLRKANPSEFPNGGNRIAVALIRGDRFVGMLVVGDRVSGVPFSVQDLDMLKCVADHATSSVLSGQSSQRLMQARELEAFQTMAAFFVHDLKNAASTLNLMLQNFPAHFDEPAFREDALRGMGKTVEHINGLIGRLALLRRSLDIRPVETDLSEVIEGTLAGLKLTGVTLEKELNTVPKLPLDQEQFQKVLTNLVLNAMEASASGGRIRIATERADRWAVMTVSDTGCGMSAEFLRDGLFRPFRTTKKSGLGIGMFQSKMIIEAHGGRIEVVSEPGRGATFQVHLPLHGN